MKKTMIFAIILMPLIVLGLMFLGGSIVYRSKYLYVENIECVDDEIILNKETDEDISQQLKVNVYPILANNKNIIFRSEDETIAVVDSEGNITSRGFGTTYVYATSAENSTKQDMCKVVVTSERVHNVWVENPASLMYVNDTLSLTTKYEPLEAKNANFTYTSSNPNVLYVSVGGELKAIDKGSATITVCCDQDPSVKHSFDVVVKYRVDDIYIAASDQGSVVSGVSNFVFPTIFFTPVQASEPITYTSSNPTIATVDNLGNIHFNKPGTVKISAKADDFDKIIEKEYTSTCGFVNSVQFIDSSESTFNYEDYLTECLPIDWTFEPADANISNISLESNNSAVVKIENGEFKVVGGGSATIKLLATKPDGTQTSVTKLIKINRKVESISLSLPDFSYTTNKKIDVACSFLPADANESIQYQVSDSNIATFENNKLSFTTGTINNKHGKVTLKAYTNNEVFKSVTIVYVDEGLPKVNIDEFENLTYNMPKFGNAEYSFALISNKADITNLDFCIVNGESNISQNGCIFTLKNNGTAKIGIKYNGQTEPSSFINLTINRLVEKIENINISAEWEGLSSFVYNQNDNIYSSSNRFVISYSIFPNNTTKTSANIEIVEQQPNNIASVSNNAIIFSSAGKVKVKIFADDATEFVQIESTNLHPDKNTTVVSSVSLNKNEQFNLWDKISISPANANLNNISFTKEGSAISIDSTGNVKALHGGTAKVFVNVKTSTNVVVNTILINITESAESITVVGQKFIYIDSNSIDLKNKFAFYPATANTNNTITFDTNNHAIATISSVGVVTFEAVGSCEIIARIDGIDEKRITVVYTGDALVVQDEQNFKVLTGTKIIIKPNTTVLSTASFDCLFVANNSNATIENGVVLTITGDTEISFNGEKYIIDCVETINSISVFPTNSNTVDFISENSYITGLTEINLSTSVTGVDSSYLKALSYSSNTQNAAVDASGKVSFDSACMAKITVTAEYKAEIFGAANVTMTAYIDIESTFGQITSLTANNTNQVFTIDNQNSQNNVLDIANLVSVFPTQLSANSSNVELSLSSDIATINGTEVCFVKGGAVSINVNIKESKYSANGTTINFDVKRSATAIYLNNKELVNGETIIINKSTIYLAPKFYPTDANINNEINWVVSENEGIATVNQTLGNIVFNQANQKIKVTFTMSSISYVVYFQTTTITYEVNILDDGYVVPVNEPFTFIENNTSISDYSIEFIDASEIVSTIGSDVYVISVSGVITAKITYKGETRVVLIVVTSNIQSISNVSLSDIDMNGSNVTIPTIEDSLSLTTASKTVAVNYDIPIGYDKYGELIDYSISVNNPSNAVVEGNNIKFKSVCEVEVTISILYEDAYQTRSINYSFSVKSTFGNVTEFALKQSNYNFVLDTMSESDKTINFANNAIRLAPLYGVVDNLTIAVDNNDMATVSNNNIVLNNFGVCNVTVGWGTATQKTAKIVVDKYIDNITILDGGEVVSQIVTKSNTYQLNYYLSVNESSKQPTITNVEFLSTGDCTVDNNGLVTFNQSNSKFSVTIKAKQGSASNTLFITKVNNNVNVISCNSELNNIVIEKDVVNIFDYRFNNSSISINNANSVINVNNNLDTFVATCGSQGQIVLSNNQTINFIATEKPTGITFAESAPNNNFLTALGSEQDNKKISISELYAPKVYPLTSRTEQGSYSIDCSTDNSDIAYVQDGYLIFNKAGKVNLVFSVANVTETRTIESTFGYVKSFNWVDSSDIVVQYSDLEYSLPNTLFTAIPTDYYKTSATISSQDDSVFTVNQNLNKLVFVGGGESMLNLSLETPTGVQTITRKVTVIHRASDVKIYDEEVLTSYMVKNYSENLNMQLNYKIIPSSSGIALSGYTLQFESSNQSVAKFNNINQNILTFVGNGETVVTISVINNFDNACDASASVRILNNGAYKVLKVNDESVEYVIESDDTNNYVLYPMPGKQVQNFSFTANGESVTVDSLGKISLNAGGETTIQISEISESNAWVKTINIFVHKSTNIVLPESIQNAISNNSSILTSKLTYNVNALFESEDTLDRKQFVYSSNKQDAAQVSNTGVITFQKAEEVEITVAVIYNNEVESSKTFKIRSSMLKAESFNVDCTQKELLVGDDVTLTISNIIPADYEGTIQLETDNKQAISLSVISNTSFKISGIYGGTGNVVVKLLNSDVSRTIPVKVVQLTESIDIYLDGTKVTSVVTFLQELSLVANVLPTNATNRNVEWFVSNGPASVDGNGKVTFTDFGKATILLKTDDFAQSGTQTTIEIERLKDIDAYSLEYNSQTLTNNQTIYVDYQIEKLELNIKVLPTNLTGSIYYQYFTAQTTNGSVVSVDTISGKINISLVSASTSPTFSETITVKYKNDKEIVVNVFRDGIKSVEFIGHDNTKDSTLGLQNIRVFGNRSYYGGIQTFYRLPIKVEPAGVLTSNIVWQITKNNQNYNKVTYDPELVEIDGVKYLLIYFNNADYSTMQNVYDDNFENGKVTLTAFNKTGRQLYTYTFNIVNAVNVWEQDGYVNGGAEIVLQKSLGHDDQAALIEKGEYSRLEAYVAKTTIYGNGNLINFAYYNSTATVNKYNYIATTLTNAINLEIQGCKIDETRDLYHLQISGPSKIAYCYLHDMYRAIELGGNSTVNIKNTMFRSFAHSSINASNDGTRNIYLENVIMFDVGQRAIEIQGSGDKVYVSGIFDVYNFQDSSGLNEVIGGIGATSSIIINKAEDAGMAVKKLNKKWANVVCIAVKDAKNRKDTIMYYNNVDNAVPGISSVSYLGYIAFATKNDHEYITWENEFLYDESTKTRTLNSAYMIGTMSKLER